jgi:Flp pilus assembly protein TadD
MLEWLTMTKNSNLTKSDRVEKLEEARMLALESNFSAADKIISELLQDRPDDVEALRLKGNVLEQAELEKNEFAADRLTLSARYIAAGACYEEILRLDATNTCALLDLGDHFLNLDALDQAQTYYSRALELLESGEFRTDWREEVSDLLERATALSRTEKKAEFGAELRVHCERLLGRTSS